jgi:hypothetical protein
MRSRNWYCGPWMADLNRCLRALPALVALCSATVGLTARADAEPRAQSRDIVAFCRTHRDLDHPDEIFFEAQYKPGMLPKQVQDVEADKWRCMDGKVFMCSDSADGDSCSKKDPNPLPSQTIKEICAERPGSDFVERAATAYSSSTWRCNGQEPAIIQTYSLDKRGFMNEMWVLYIARTGPVTKPHEPLDFPAPR